MFGPPKDVKGQCNAKLFIGDDYGDNFVTMRCQLKPGHGGAHQEKHEPRQSDGQEVTILWKNDESNKGGDAN